MLVILLTTVFILLIIRWLSASPFKWRGKGIHWIVPWPIFGNIGLALTSSYFDFWLNFYNSFRGHKMIGFHYFQTPALLIRDPELLKQIMVTEADNFNAHVYYTKESDFFGRNIFSTKGQEWKDNRSKMTPFFSPVKIKAMVPTIESLVDCFIAEIEQKLKNGPVKVDDISLKLSTDSIVTYVFGLEPECFKNHDSFFVKLQREIPGYLFGLRNLLGAMSPTLYKLLGLTAFRAKTTSKIRGFIKQIIDSSAKGQVSRQNLMQGMVELYNKDSLMQDHAKYNSDGTPVARFDLNGITAQGMILFLGGTETTGQTLNFLLYELATNQDIQDKLREEIMDETASNIGTLSYEHIQKMTYLNMVVEETLRLHPVAPFVPRMCTKETTINGVKIDKGTVIGVCIVGIHRDPKIHDDPDRFDPERFRPGVKREVGTYLPFGLGPRTCLGMKLAEVEIKSAICRLVSKYRILPSPETPRKVKHSLGFTTGPKGGLKLDFEPI